MERHKCKLCTRSFTNGRALGGHMKGHLATLPLPKKTQQSVDTTIESAASASLEEEEKNRGGGGGEEKGLVYGLRENPKKSFRVADPKFSFVAEPHGTCVVVQDGESETESRNPTRRRSKRNRKFENQKMKFETKKAKQSGKQSWVDNNNEYQSSPADPEPVSSVSDASPEENVAMCLMMLSRDCWMKEQDQRSVEKSKETKLSKKIRCEKCKKGFRSLQALGGHKRICEQGKIPANEKIFECPFCFKVFGSGQALGGHKRSHISASSTSSATTPTKLDAVSAVSIDLNLPAPMEQDEYSVVSEK
ncbi:hypothetical protein HS088_TW15G00400 [Tripterygium wilfordii]|uniref:C2H2-type domain-containing protein n=1 Tax=Tripterygium wilfordii TaxID=458696 RepID=A0A7J7CLF8_TRIWF|nr:zinc finger protein ZAT1-like [Tripterygium wilfordii]KAF5734903.1 hypothetical protein HS088_TW15G00400 [Tripterygium wilfordii]